MQELVWRLRMSRHPEQTLEYLNKSFNVYEKLIYLFSLCLLLASCGHKMQTQPSPASFVNPLMGTSSTFAFSHGNTYPAVAVPWGMNFWSPQTGENGSGWMYMYTDSLIRGFRQTHQPSPWINDYGTFSIMPLLGKVIMDNKSRGVGFRHENEKRLRIVIR